MTTIARLAGGVKVHIYGLDHPPPHVHFRSAEYYVRVEIATKKVVAQEGSYTGRDEKMFVRWIREHEADLVRIWTLARSGYHVPKLKDL